MIDEQLVSLVCVFIVRQLRAAGTLLAIRCLTSGITEAIGDLRWTRETYNSLPSLSPQTVFDLTIGIFLIKVCFFPWL